MTVRRCSSELVLLASSEATLEANSSTLEPSVARRILVGKMLIWFSSLEAVSAKRIVSSHIGPGLTIMPYTNFGEFTFQALGPRRGTLHRVGGVPLRFPARHSRDLLRRSDISNKSDDALLDRFRGGLRGGQATHRH